MSEFYNKMKYFEEIEEIPAEIYYHYTSLDALYSIVTSKTVRLTSLKSSNDKKELYYKSETFLKDFANVCDKEKDEETKRSFCLIEESIDLYKAEFLKACKGKTYPYALCLSEKKDNLTHWDRYAVNCTGVSIGFNISALRVLMQRMAISAFGVGVYDIGKVLYSSAQKERFLRNYLVKITKALSKQKEVDSSNSSDIIQKSGYVYAASAYLQIAKFAKNNSFVDEDEVRLYHDAASIKETLRLIELIKTEIDLELYTNLKHNFEEFVNLLHINKEEFCVSARGIRSYRDLCLNEVWGDGTIAEIILGPMCIQNKNELKRFLKANGLAGTKVSISEVPIR